MELCVGIAKRQTDNQKFPLLGRLYIWVIKNGESVVQMTQAKSFPLLVILVLASGCASNQVTPGTKLVEIAPQCRPDSTHDYFGVREDPESTFALEQSGVLGGVIGLSAASGVAGSAAAAVAAPVALIPLFMAANGSVNKERARHTGVIERAKVSKVRSGDDELFVTRYAWGVSADDTPPRDLINERIVTVYLEGGMGGAYAATGVYATKELGVEPGDIVDIKTVFGRYADQRSLFSSYSFGSSDFNKHIARVSRVVCKHNDQACQSILDNRAVGIVCRHQQTEYSADEYLISPEDIKIAKNNAMDE